MHQNASKGFSSQLSVRVHNYYFSNDIFLFLCKPPSSALNFSGEHATKGPTAYPFINHFWFFNN